MKLGSRTLNSTYEVDLDIHSYHYKAHEIAEATQLRNSRKRLTAHTEGYPEEATASHQHCPASSGEDIQGEKHSGGCRIDEGTAMVSSDYDKRF